VQQVLKAKLYILGRYNDERTNFGTSVQIGDKHVIDKFYEPPDIEQILQNELEARQSKLLISGKW
jgi:hypothetical protein